MKKQIISLSLFLLALALSYLLARPLGEFYLTFLSNEGTFGADLFLSSLVAMVSVLYFLTALLYKVFYERWTGHILSIAVVVLTLYGTWSLFDTLEGLVILIPGLVGYVLCLGIRKLRQRIKKHMIREIDKAERIP